MKNRLTMWKAKAGLPLALPTELRGQVGSMVDILQLNQVASISVYKTYGLLNVSSPGVGGIPGLVVQKPVCLTL